MTDEAAPDEDPARRNPYVGLRPFFKADSLYFFGREAQTEALLGILATNRFLGVVGSSGSGKSSLVRAGLVPSLLGGFLVQDRDRWRKVSIKPGDAPIGNLATGLVEAMAQDDAAESAGAASGSEAVQRLEAEIRAGHTEAVLDFVRARLEPNANLFVLVDQFEEIFAFRGDDETDDQPDADPARKQERARRKAEASDFVDLLLALGEQRALPIYVVLTMRTDFLGDCDLFYGLPEALNRGRYLVPRMTREQLRDAIECPALLVDAQIAPRLVDQLLNALGDRFDRLPVLQHALMRTFDDWYAEGGKGPVDLRHFDGAGGLEGALDQDAENAMGGLDAIAVERIFKRLTDTDSSQRRIRSPARISELVAAAGIDRSEVERILARFEGDGRSFVHAAPDGRPEDPRVDISHESLIRQWTRLRDWVDAERKSRDSYVELVDRAAKWQRQEATPLQGPELRLVRNWQKVANPTPGWAARYARGNNDYALALRYISRSVWRVRIGRVTAVSATLGVIIALAALSTYSNQIIETATKQNNDLVASVYRKLDPIAGTESARRDLIDRTMKLNFKLTRGDKSNQSNLFWSQILKGDEITNRATDAFYDTDQATPDDTINNEMIKAEAAYRAAVQLAIAQTRVHSDDTSWFENLSTALTKLSDIVAIEEAAKICQAAVSVDRYLVGTNLRKKEWLTNLVLSLGKMGNSCFDPTNPAALAASRAPLEESVEVATQLLALDPSDTRSMTVYIDAYQPLLNVFAAQPDENAQYKMQLERLIYWAKRRHSADKKNKIWNSEYESFRAELNALNGIVEAPKPSMAARSSAVAAGQEIHY